jgi:hypothetical protein
MVSNGCGTGNDFCWMAIGRESVLLALVGLDI